MSIAGLLVIQKNLTTYWGNLLLARKRRKCTWEAERIPEKISKVKTDEKWFIYSCKNAERNKSNAKRKLLNVHHKLKQVWSPNIYRDPRVKRQSEPSVRTSEWSSKSRNVQGYWCPRQTKPNKNNSATQQNHHQETE